MAKGGIDTLPASRRRRLVLVAAREFGSAGYERASLNRIIGECRMSKSSFYYVLSSKRDLFDLVVRDLARAALATVHIPPPGEFAGERFWPTVDRLLDELLAVSGTDESFALLGRMVYLTGVPDATITATMAAVERWIGEVLEAGRRSAAVRADLAPALQTRLVFAVLRTIDEWAVANRARLPADAPATLIETVKTTLRRLLQPEPT